VIAAAASTTGRLRRWLSVRHSLGLEAALVVALYGVYELARGLVVGDTKEADRHADQLVALERSLHLFVEGKVQHAADALPGLAGLLDVAYLTLHLAVTAAVLLGCTSVARKTRALRVFPDREGLRLGETKRRNQDAAVAIREQRMTAAIADDLGTDEVLAV
jgi:PAP2 superfamily